MDRNPTVAEAINALKGHSRSDADRKVIDETATGSPVIVWEVDGEVYMASVEMQTCRLKMRKLVGDTLAVELPFKIQQLLWLLVQ